MSVIDVNPITTETTSQDIASAKILINQGFDGSTGFTVHMVADRDAQTALCALDVSNAKWAKGGDVCQVCDHLEDVDYFNKTGYWPPDSVWPCPSERPSEC